MADEGRVQSEVRHDVTCASVAVPYCTCGATQPPADLTPLEVACLYPETLPNGGEPGA